MNCIVKIYKQKTTSLRVLGWTPYIL